MDRASVESTFSVSPYAPGSFHWSDDTTFIFTPVTPLSRDTAYIFRIESAARSKTGIGLRDTFSLKLHTTGYLVVTQFFPDDDAANVNLQPTITVVFNRPVVPLGTAEQMQNGLVPLSQRTRYGRKRSMAYHVDLHVQT